MRMGIKNPIEDLNEEMLRNYQKMQGLLSQCPSGNENPQRWALAQVSNSEMSSFSQNQGKQGIARRRTDRTPHKQSRRLTQPARHCSRAGEADGRLWKRAISGWKLAICWSETSA
jgi:hypothetical protein